MRAVRLDLPSTIESIHLLDALISEMLNLMQVDEQISHQINLAVIEAGTNAIKHGNAADPEKYVHFEFQASSEKMTILVQDSGCLNQHKLQESFSLAQAGGDNNLTRSAGRGLQLIDAYMDEVIYDIASVKMIKRIKNWVGNLLN